jgi:hypothetical protein
MNCLGLLMALFCIGWERPALAVIDSSSGRFETLRQQDLRVASVSYRLSVANRALCGAGLVPQPGFILHSLEQYGAADRAQAARSFGLGLHVGVMAVVRDSPARRAGLEADDQLLSINGRLLNGSPAIKQAPTRASVERAEQIVAAEMRKGEVTLRVLRAGASRDVIFTADPGCATNVELVPGADANAWADGARVVVSAGILAYCGSDDDLALVIAHELAHNLLRHSQKSAQAGMTGSGHFALLGAGSARTREAEEEADRLAVRIATAAAYDLGHAAAFLGRLMNRDPGTILADTHPRPERRLALLSAEITAAGGGSEPTPKPSR